MLRYAMLHVCLITSYIILVACYMLHLTSYMLHADQIFHYCFVDAFDIEVEER